MNGKSEYEKMFNITAVRETQIKTRRYNYTLIKIVST